MRKNFNKYLEVEVDGLGAGQNLRQLLDGRLLSLLSRRQLVDRPFGFDDFGRNVGTRSVDVHADRFGRLFGFHFCRKQKQIVKNNPKWLNIFFFTNY